MATSNCICNPLQEQQLCSCDTSCVRPHVSTHVVVVQASRLCWRIVAAEPGGFCFFRYPTVCQAVLNTFACYHIDTGSGLYADNQLVRSSRLHVQSTANTKTFVPCLHLRLLPPGVDA